MKKAKRKSIRLNGALVTKRFHSAEAANTWYSQMHTKKVYSETKLPPPKAKKGVLLKDFAMGEFMEKRKLQYPESTWRADEQRLRDHVLPALGNFRLSRLTTPKLRVFLESLVDEKGLSPKTRDRVQALVSVLYTEAINRHPDPLCDHNPTFGITFRRGKRIGVKTPSHLHTTEQVMRYLKAAKELSLQHLGVAALGVMAGLRKQEMIALRNRQVDLTSGAIEVREKFEQVSGKILKGTKAGEETVRFIPISESLGVILNQLMTGNKNKEPNDFLLQNDDGSHLSPKQVYRLNSETCKRAKLSVTVHGLRHTFGREFAERSGNLQALQDILGHSNYSTTQIYSTLGKDRLKGFRGVMDYDI